MNIRVAPAGDVEIAYQDSGPEEAPTVLMGHCFCADHRFWDAHLPACEGFRAIRFDTRGHGQSGRTDGPYSLSLLAGDVIALMDHLGIAQAHYVGVSMGGMIGQTLATDHPSRLRSLTLVNTTPKYSDEQRDLWRARADGVLANGIEPIHADLMRRWFTDHALTDGVPGARYIAEIIRSFDRRSFASVTAAMCELDTVDRLPEIAVPTLVVAAPEDPGVPREVSELLASRIPDARLEWLHPARHLASLEHVARFNALLRAHLALAEVRGC
ncbi:MAG: alpha/beta fold hydrolase [Pseudomonadota bacterium]